MATINSIIGVICGSSRATTSNSDRRRGSPKHEPNDPYGHLPQESPSKWLWIKRFALHDSNVRPPGS
jgi:hypothetical protein